MIQALRSLRERNEAAALVLIFLATFLFPKGVPAGIYGLGIVSGASIALNAIGLVLVYRSNRIINFAQVQFGAVAATFFISMVQFFPLGRAIRAICPPCLDRPSPTVLRFNYYISLVLAFALSVLISYLVYTFVVKRFANAPRLVTTVATIFVVQILGGIQRTIPDRLATEDQLRAGIQLNAAGAPFRWTLQWSPARFQTPEILTFLIGLIAVAGLLVYFRRSSTGVAIRASSENPSRSSTLGVNVDAVTGRVWVVAGALSGAAGLLGAMTQGAAIETGLNVSAMMKMLAVAVIARMVSLPITAVAAVVFGILQQAMQWSYGTTIALDGLLVIIIGTVLLLQRHRASRAEIEQASAWKADREIRPIPRELWHLPVIRSWVRWGIALGIVVMLGFPWAMSPAQTNLAALWMIHAMIGLSLLVLTGWAGQISLGQFALAAVGGYVAALWGLPFPIALVTGAVTGAIVAVAVGIPAIKLRGLHLAITSLAFALATSAILLNPRYLGRHLPDTLDRPSLLGMSFDDGRVFYYFTLLTLAMVNVAIIGLRHSRTARALIAARDNERAAQAFGINLVRARMSAFAMSGFVAAFAGGLLAFHQHGVKGTAYPPEESVNMFLISVIGGFGAVAGPQLGALYYGILGLVSNNAVVQFLGTGGVGLAILMIMPGGLAGGLQQVRDSFLRRVAKRNRIVVPSLLADVRVDGIERERAPIQPRLRTGGSAVFVPARYQLDDQWAIGVSDDTFLHANLQKVRASSDDGRRSTFGSASSTGENIDG